MTYELETMGIRHRQATQYLLETCQLYWIRLVFGLDYI